MKEERWQLIVGDIHVPLPCDTWESCPTHVFIPYWVKNVFQFYPDWLEKRKEKELEPLGPRLYFSELMESLRIFTFSEEWWKDSIVRFFGPSWLEERLEECEAYRALI